MTQLLGGHLHYNKMCTNKRYITNPYTGERLFVNCGHCPSCLQQKANKVAQRIRNSINDDEVVISLTLTYDNRFIPYVLRSDIENSDCYELPIYRDFEVRRFKDNFIVRPCERIIATLPLVNEETGKCIKKDVFFYPNIRSKDHGFSSNKMAISYYKDLQDFFKRFRQTLKRDYGLENGCFRSFQCCEYGETTFRPHFHCLLSTKRENFEYFRSAFFKSWQYADSSELRRCFEIARNMANYVASYVNSNTDIPKVFTSLKRPQHSCSKNFGVEYSEFSLSSLLEKANNGSLVYYRQTRIDGKPTVLTVPIPKYVINRYFPLFKGLSRLSSVQIYELLSFPYIGFRFHKFSGLTNYVDCPLDDDYFFKYQNVLHLENKNDSWSNYIRIRHAVDNYISCTGNTIFDFAIDYSRVWNCFKNTIYRLQYDSDIVTSPFEMFDNISDYLLGGVRSYSLDNVSRSNYELKLNANEFKLNRKLTDYYSQLFFKKKKNKKTNSYIYSKLSNNF